MIMKQSVAAILLAVPVLTLAGCHAVTKSSDEPWSAPVVTAAQLDAELAKLPLAGYRMSGKDMVLQSRAQELLTQRCMKRFGLPLALTSTEELRLLQKRVDSEDRVGIGLVDESIAGRYGYHGRPEDADLEVSGKGSVFTAEQQQVLTGAVDTFAGQPVPAGGCRGEAARDLIPRSGSSQPNSAPPHSRVTPGAGTNGDNLVNLQMASRDIANSTQQIKADEHFGDMVKAWHDCMAKSGYKYDSPTAAAEYFSNRPPGNDEVKTAVADVRCKAEVNYLGVYLTLARRYQQAMLDKREVAYREVLTAKEKVLKKAAQILSE